MSHDESCQDRQNNELEVLKSIFGDELCDFRKNKQKKKWQPLDIAITLTPQQGMSGPVEVYAQVDLHVACGDNYPKDTPKIRLQNSRGLSDQQLALHLSELEALAKELKGEVMIFELCQHVQKFLHEHNKPGYSSFYEEMVLKRQERIQCELQEKQLKEDKERQVLQDEILKRKEALKAEMRNRRESARLSLESDPILSQSIPSSPHERVRTYSRRRCMSTSESSEGSLCEHRGTKFLHFDNNKGERQVHRGKCLGHSAKGSVVYAGVDIITGELLAITEWTLKCGSIDNHENGELTNLQHSMKQIASIEQELNHLYRLHHPNLVQYLNMKYIQDKDNIIIYTLQEFVVGTTCSFYLTENIPVDTDMLRYLAAGILTALEFLHENNVVHKDLRDSSVHIDRTGLIKVSDYSLDKRLSDIYRASSLAKVEHDFPTSQGRGGKKADIYRFGILLLSLVKGSIVSEKEIEVDSSLQPDLRDFVNKCLVTNERARWSAEQLLQHCFIRAPLERGLSPPRLDGNQEQNRIEPEQEPDADVHFYLPAFGGQSRLQNEFEVIRWLGKGAFGDVFKVKNKLDGGIYAIKRIKLNPKNKQLNRKITREVKLLSRLNHENVVRYYNSWIETANIDDMTRHTPSTTPSIKFTSTTEDKTSSVGDYLGSENVEKLAPPLHDVEWNASYGSRASVALSADSEEDNSDHSDDSDLSDDDWAFIMRTRVDSSDSIEFERDGTSQTSESVQNSQDLVVEKNKNETENDESSKEIQVMFIQMEFCEKSTLRTAIDNGLYEDEERIWRLFREIIEGLAHIHQQGMIHRDLKPVNIFLDSNDHVKIGDFGLATTNILSFTQTLEAEKESQISDKGVSFDMDDLGSMTGQVGTALYVAPELSAQAAKAIYNQKVDIYSLGVIFFEMCYKPLTTGMERVKVLLNLRSKDIVLPSELSERGMTNHIHILRWLLNHDPSQRPTSQELLSSEYLPPAQLEEAELQEMVRHTLSNAQSRAYKHLVACCFAQEVTPAEDITYDMNLPARNTTNSLLPKYRFFYNNIKTKVVNVFQKHGGISINTPLLMPKSGPLYSTTDSCVRLMTRTGSIVSIPHDLRAPFARYVAWNNISSIRRYAIERVYREKKVHGFHPRELYECAFDIISPMPNNLMAEAELIFIAWEICNEIPQLQERNFTVRINHTSLLQAVLMYCGIEREKYQDIYSILCDARDGKFSRFQVQTHLISLCLTDQAMETLFNLFETESSVAKIASVLKTITKRKGDAAALAKEGLREIEIVIANAEALGVKCPITVVPLLVHNIQQHSGIIYQITCEIKKRRRRGGQEVIAAGGRYDKMLASFRQVLERTGMASKETKQFGVGISISLDKLASAACELSEDLCRDNKFAIDVAVCCVDGVPRREKELADVLRELWSLDLRVTCLDFSTTEEILEYCRENGINHVVMLKSGEKGSLRIETWERDRFQGRKISIQDVTEHFQRQTENVLPITLNRSESKLSTNTELMVSSNPPVNVNINFILSDRDKLSGSGRRSYKNAMQAQMSSYLQRISHKVPIEVFAVFLDMAVVRTITNFLEIDENDQDFQKSIQVVIDKHQRHKKYIKQICDEMWEARNDKSRPVLILYSLSDSQYMTLV
ncbi:eIF-2-alpha kinase GCN2 [Nasonia vitripennis]|uniref:non-specific serine/threonine protein kinase n=1 Tax=Nasonia vitripennis TaxID=7425 RepID=A0A7M7T9U0_NASVI|nr:eIF-2-alpha kinase GCN2 [Nasonia vitripennis]